MEIPIIEMQSEYPFGLATTHDNNMEILVHKELSFADEQQQQMINHMVHFYKTVNHPQLVNLVNTTQQPNAYHLYYEYVPIKLQPWLLGINQDLTQELEDQLLELVQFLTSSSLLFKFQPSSVGLSSNMTIKYFLKEFSVDMGNQGLNCNHIQNTIKKYFIELKKEAGISEERKANKSARFASVSTNSSVSHLEQFKGLTNSEHKPGQKVVKLDQKSLRMKKLYDKIQNSKQKSQQVLQKLKLLNKG